MSGLKRHVLHVNSMWWLRMGIWRKFGGWFTTLSARVDWQHNAERVAMMDHQERHATLWKLDAGVGYITDVCTSKMVAAPSSWIKFKGFKFIRNITITSMTTCKFCNKGASSFGYIGQNASRPMSLASRHPNDTVATSSMSVYRSITHLLDFQFIYFIAQTSPVLVQFSLEVSMTGII